MTPANRKTDIIYIFHQYALPVVITLLSVVHGELFRDSQLIFLNLGVWTTFFLFLFLETSFAAGAKKQLRKLSDGESSLQTTKVVGEQNVQVPVANLQFGDRVLVQSGETIPTDGVVIDGLAAVDESALTGESAPVVRETSEDRKFVTAGSLVLNGRIIVEVTGTKGACFIDRVKQLISISDRVSDLRQERFSRYLFSIFALTFIALLVVAVLNNNGHDFYWNAIFCLAAALALAPAASFVNSIALNRGTFVKNTLHMNYVPKSVSILEQMASTDVLVLDKTGTITVGDRKAKFFVPLPGVKEKALAEAAQLASLTDETSEGRSIVVLAKELFGIRAQGFSKDVVTVSFSSESQVSGLKILDSEGRCTRIILKGSPTAIKRHIESLGASYPHAAEEIARSISELGDTPLIICIGQEVLGAIALSDRVRGGLREQLARIRDMGIREIMLTGDDPVTSEKVGKLIGVEIFASVATPKRKLEIVQYLQEHGSRVLMIGDDANDAPAMAKADVSIAMNSGAHVTREVCGIIDLQSNPVRVGKLIRLAKKHRSIERLSYWIFSILTGMNLVVTLPILLRWATGSRSTIFSPWDIQSPLVLIAGILFAELIVFSLFYAIQKYVSDRLARS